MKRSGLLLDSDLKGCLTVPVKPFSQSEYDDRPDVVFVCVKTYSLAEVAPLVARVADRNTLVVPVMNGFGIGDRLAALVPEAAVLDGCVYIVAYRQDAGRIAQRGPTFTLYFGPRRGQEVSVVRMEALDAALRDAGIGGGLSAQMDRETFFKWTFVSAMACSGAYFGVPMGCVGADPEKRGFFAALVAESAAVGRALGFATGAELVERHLATIGVMDAGSLTSMQRDMAAGHESEVDDLLVRMIHLGRSHGLEMPTYGEVARRLLSAG